MLALGVAQRTFPVEPIVEVRVQMVSLMREHRTKGTAIGWESPIPLVHVVAVSDRGGDGTVRVVGSSRKAARICDLGQLEQARRSRCEDSLGAA
jgi:hypothetical protein